MTGKILIAFMTQLVLANICLGDRPSSAAMFSDSTQLSKLSDREFETKWRSLDVDDQIKVLREANRTKAHPLRSRKSALRDVVAKTPTHIAGSETATLHGIYVGELSKLAVEIWDIKLGTEKKSEAERFEAIKAYLVSQ
jgi:hypothetical protein